MKKQILLLCMITASVFVTFADKTIYVAPAVQGTGDGTSAANACTFTNVLGSTTPVVSATVPLDATGFTTIILPSGGSFQEKTGSATSARIVFPASCKVIIEGNNSTLSGYANDTRILRVGTGGNITIKNIIFKDGAHLAAPGAAIFFGGDDLVISNCTFDNNNSEDGGAITSRGKNVKISNSCFKNNKISGTNGAAIVHTGTTTGGSLSVENTTFYNNTGASAKPCYGTAICTAYDNYPNAGGTKGYLNTVDITNCTFFANKSATNLTEGYATVYLSELVAGTNSTTATFVNNIFYGNSNCGIYIAGVKQTVKLINNVIVGDSYSNVSGSGIYDNGVIAGSTIANGRPAITGYNNYIVAKTPTSASISELSSGTNGNTFATIASQNDIDLLGLSSALQTSVLVPYLAITTSSSPLVEKGISLFSGVTIPSTDSRGVTRGSGTTGTKFDIGAYEFDNLTTNIQNVMEESFVLRQTSGEISIESLDGKYLQVNIYSTTGQSIYSVNANKLLTIQKNQLPKGVMILTVNNGIKSVAKKMVL